MFSTFFCCFPDATLLSKLHNLFLRRSSRNFQLMASPTGTGSFHCSANFPVIMFLNIFINEVIRVHNVEAGGRKFTNSTQIPLTIFHHLGGKFKIWNLNWERRAQKCCWNDKLRKHFSLYFSETRSERGIGPATKTRGSVFVWIWADSRLSPPILAASFRIYLVSFTSQFSQEINKWTKILRSSIHNKLTSIWGISSFLYC